MSLNTFPCNPYPISTEELNKGNNDDLNTRVSALETAVEEIDNDKADLGVIAAEFDAEAGTYEIGDLVTNEGKLYEFTSDHSTPGEWDPTEVTEKTVADEVNSVKSGLTNVESELASKVSVSKVIIGANSSANIKLDKTKIYDIEASNFNNSSVYNYYHEFAIFGTTVWTYGEISKIESSTVNVALTFTIDSNDNLVITNSGNYGANIIVKIATVAR